ncbi:peptidase E [Egibacter rhizosphaerae]|uniref:Peptidase E n=1 Tax=Egibacter rhizosphaerae TaxID=1670831 RepID=A0A411YKU8_9ACTN|nr:peptidase E [Egibacter rhizosphaerae]QBI21822.1 peptidase E [Egibacter rhizosphaerae]
MRRGQVIALGGGGFSTDPDDPTLDDYVLAQADRDHPRVGFLPTASGDAPDYVQRFHAGFAGRCAASHLRLFSPPSAEPERWIAAQDVIYVGGGSTANLLAVWRVHGVDRLLAAAHDRGAVLCGISAGAMCWFEAGITDSFGPLAPLHDGLGILAGSCTPHYDGEAERRPALHRALAEGLPAGYAIDDGAAAHFVDRRLHQCVTSRRNAAVHWVEHAQGRVREQRLGTTALVASY